MVSKYPALAMRIGLFYAGTEPAPTLGVSGVTDTPSAVRSPASAPSCSPRSMRPARRASPAVETMAAGRKGGGDEDDGSEDLVVGEVDIFVGPNYVLSVRHRTHMREDR